MHYQILSSKYRPKNFSKFIGHKYIKTSLINILKKKKIHNAYLFTGTRGIGKTSIARILAKCLNCNNGISHDPCNKCFSCIHIDKNKHPDFIEIDAASYAKIEDIRTILESLQYSPIKSRYKIYLIDEFHMLSKHSFNALLKNLEEPLDHIKFIMATTKANKIPDTILSRCIRFQLFPFQKDEIVCYLKEILIKEKIDFDNQAIDLLSYLSNGSIRDAINLLDQSICFNENIIRKDDITKLFHIIDENIIYKLITCVFLKNVKETIEIINKIFHYTNNVDYIFSKILEIFYYIMLYQKTSFVFSKEILTLNKILEHHSNNIFYYYEIIIEYKKYLYLAPNEKIGLEMALFKIIAFIDNKYELFNNPNEKKYEKGYFSDEKNIDFIIKTLELKKKDVIKK